MSSEAKDLINKLLAPDHRSRLLACDVLDHPWIRETTNYYDGVATLVQPPSVPSSFRLDHEGGGIARLQSQRDATRKLGSVRIVN